MNGRASKWRHAPDIRLIARSKVWLEAGDRFVIGEGGVALLEAIRRTGSLRRASAEMKWSYRHAWEYLRQMEAAVARKIVLTQPRRPRDGARLTADGESLLLGLRTLQESIAVTTTKTFRTVFRATARPEPSEPPRSPRLSRASAPR